jgi:hypothetical protein
MRLFCNSGQARIDGSCEKDRTLQAVLVGILREAERMGPS